MKFFFISTFWLIIALTPITAPEAPQNGAEGTVAGTKQSEVGKFEGDKPKLIETGGNLREGKKSVDDMKTMQQVQKLEGAEKTSSNAANYAGDAKVTNTVDRPESVKDSGKNDHMLYKETVGVDKDREPKRPDGLERKENRDQPIGNFGQKNEKPEQIDSLQGKDGKLKPVEKDRLQGTMPADKSRIGDKSQQVLYQGDSSSSSEDGPQPIDSLQDGKPKRSNQLQGVEEDRLQGTMPADKYKIGDKSQQVLSPGDSSSSPDDGPQQVRKPQWNEMEWKQDNHPAEKSKNLDQGDTSPLKPGVVQLVDKVPGKAKDSYTSDVSSSGDQEMHTVGKPANSKGNKNQQQYNTPNVNVYDKQKLNEENEEHKKLVQDFDKLSEDIKRLDKKLDRYDKLELHGLYKQATDGECTVAKPSMMHLRERAKWHAWKAKEGTSKDAAMRIYVSKARFLITKFGS